MASPAHSAMEWITLNLATCLTAMVAWFNGAIILEVLAGLSIATLMFFNFWRAMNQIEDYRDKIRKREREKLLEQLPNESTDPKPE